MVINLRSRHARLQSKWRDTFKLAIQVKGSDVKCLFKKGSSIVVYKAGSQGHQKPEHESKSLQRL